MPDDITQPFGGAPSTSAARTPAMTVDELRRRVFQAEQRIMSAIGADIGRSEVVLSPEDWIDVVVEKRGSAGYPEIRFDDASGRYYFRDHPMRVDNGLQRGDVRLRSEVHA